MTIRAWGELAASLAWSFVAVGLPVATNVRARNGNYVTLLIDKGFLVKTCPYVVQSRPFSRKNGRF